MPTRETESPGVGAAAKQVAEHASTLARLEVELATLEVKSKVAALGIGAGLTIAAAVIALFALGFGLAAGAVALAIVLDAWLALLLVFAGLLLLAGALVLIGVNMFKRGTPPVPKQAIEEAKRTQEALRNGAH
jgi:Putative Actinobacterial Holin-X, holin superfamily III